MSAAKTKKDESPTPNLDIMLSATPPEFVRCKLKPDTQPHFVRKGMVQAGEEFVTNGKHAKELFEVGAIDVLGVAENPDKAPAELATEAAAEAEGNPAATARPNPPGAVTGEQGDKGNA